MKNHICILFLFALVFASCGDGDIEICLDESRTPTITSNGGTKIFKCYDIDWEVENTIVEFQVQVAPDERFNESELLVDENVLAETYEFLAPARGTYFARVRSITGDCGSEWSEPLQLFFDIFPETTCRSAEGVEVPSPRFPDFGSDQTFGADVKFKWTIVGGGIYYHINIAPVSDFSELTEYQNLIYDTEYETSFEEAGTYFWRVRTYDENDQYTAWSEVWQFTVLPE